MSSFKIIATADSMFGESSARGLFAAQIQAAIDNPDKVIEFEWPQELDRGKLTGRLQAGAALTPWRISYRADPDRGLVQIRRGGPRHPGFVEESEAGEAGPRGAPLHANHKADRGAPLDLENAQRQRNSRLRRPASRGGSNGR